MIKKITWIFFYFLVFLAYFLISLPYYSGDIKNHLAWGKSIVEFGTYGFYDRTFPGYSFPTYPPLITLLFGLSFWFYQLVLNLANHLNLSLGVFPSRIIWFMEWENTLIAFIKLSGTIPVIILGYLLVRFSKIFNKEIIVKNRKLPLAILFLNPAVIYLAAIWGQTDILQNLLLLLAFYFLFIKKLWPSFIFAALAILSKQTILILWGVYFVTLFKLDGFKKMLDGILVNLAVFYLAYLPFHDLSITWPIWFYRYNMTLVDFGVAENALNLWGFLYNFKSASSNQLFLSLPLDIWGYLMLAVLSIPLLTVFWFRKFSYQKFFQLLFLISIIYFFVLTRMHERYLIPAVIYSAMLILFGKKYWISFIFFSLLHFLNLYKGLTEPNISFLTAIVKSTMALNILVLGYFILIIYNYYLYIKND